MLRDNKGFTLIEIMSVLVVLGVIVGIVASKFDVFHNSARRSSVLLTVEELNSREKMTWSNIKLSYDGYVDDETLFGLIDYDLSRIRWISGPTISGGIIDTAGGNVSLTRTESSRIEPAKWTE